MSTTDQSKLVDLLNGAGNFIVWNGKTLPANSCDGGSLQFEGGAPPFTVEEENLLVADWFVNYLGTGDPKDEESEMEFLMIVDSLT